MTGSSAPTPPEFLTPAESAEVDSALLSSREKFTARVAIYSLRSLKQISQEQGIDIEQISSTQLSEWIAQDESLQQAGLDSDRSFRQFFARLVLASLKPLRQIAQDGKTAIGTLTPSQVIVWFEQEAKARLEQN